MWKLNRNQIKRIQHINFAYPIKMQMQPGFNIHTYRIIDNFPGNFFMSVEHMIHLYIKQHKLKLLWIPFHFFSTDHAEKMCHQMNELVWEWKKTASMQLFSNVIDFDAVKIIVKVKAYFNRNYLFISQHRYWIIDQLFGRKNCAPSTNLREKKKDFTKTQSKRDTFK